MVSDLLLEIYKQAKVGAPIAMPNRTFEPPSNSLWCKWQLMPTTTRRGNLRDIERAGILQITLFVPIGTDDTLIDDKAKAIAAHFGTEKAHMVDGHNVLIMSSHIEPAMPDSDGKWYMTPISIEYEII